MTQPDHSAETEVQATLPLQARRHPLIPEVKRGLFECCGPEACGPIVLAVSGGRDSVALLIAVAAMQRHADFDLHPHVVHVHHHLRPEADAESDHVVKLADALGIDVQVRHVDVTSAGGTARHARDLRYEALQTAAIEANASWVATAHHAEDQLETMIAAMGRGAGPRGLAGMPRTRSLCERVMLIRPMLCTSRQQAQSLCEAAQVRWCDDPGNVDPATPRGRIRRDVLPVLEALWPGAASRAATASLLQATAASALDEVVARVLSSLSDSSSGQSWPREGLTRYPPGVVASALRRAVLAVGVIGPDRISHRSLDAAVAAIFAEGRHRRHFEIGGGVDLIIDAESVRLSGAGRSV